MVDGVAVGDAGDGRDLGPAAGGGMGPQQVTCLQPEMHSENGGPFRYCPCGWMETGGLESARIYNHGGYEFAGTTVAGENLMSCNDCGATLKSSSEARHRNWHEQLGQ